MGTRSRSSQESQKAEVTKRGKRNMKGWKLTIFLVIVPAFVFQDKKKKGEKSSMISFLLSFPVFILFLSLRYPFLLVILSSTASTSDSGKRKLDEEVRDRCVMP